MDKEIPEHEEHYNVANTLRAVLDLIETGHLRYLKNFRDDFFCTDKYNQEFFEKVWLLRGMFNWEDINHLMKYEFRFECVDFVKGRG